MQNVAEVKRSVCEHETGYCSACMTGAESSRENRSADSRDHERDQHQNVVRRGDSNSEEAKRQIENLPAEEILRYRK